MLHFLFKSESLDIVYCVSSQSQSSCHKWTRVFWTNNTEKRGKKPIHSWKTCRNHLKIALQSIIQLNHQLWSHEVPSFFTLLLSLSRVIAEPQTGKIWREKTTLIVGMGRKPCPLLRFLDSPTTKPRDGSIAPFMKVSCRYSKTPFWFRSAINMLLSNVILRCNEVSQCPTIEGFYFLKIQTWASVGKCTARLVRTLQVTDVSIPFFRWLNNLRNYENISS